MPLFLFQMAKKVVQCTQLMKVTPAFLEKKSSSSTIINNLICFSCQSLSISECIVRVCATFSSWILSHFESQCNYSFDVTLFFLFLQFLWNKKPQFYCGSFKWKIHPKLQFICHTFYIQQHFYYTRSHQWIFISFLAHDANTKIVKGARKKLSFWF